MLTPTVCVPSAIWQLLFCGVVFFASKLINWNDNCVCAYTTFTRCEWSHGINRSHRINRLRWISRSHGVKVTQGEGHTGEGHMVEIYMDKGHTGEAHTG